MKLKHEDLYNTYYKQKMDLMLVLRQQQAGKPAPALRDESAVLADFLAFIRAGCSGNERVIIVANSLRLLTLLWQKCHPEDLAIFTGD